MQKEKLCYSYNPETLLYQGEEYADKHPFEESYILPAHCTFLKPKTLPRGSQELLRYVPEGDSWEIIVNPNFIEEQRYLRKMAYREHTDDLFMKSIRLRVQGEFEKAKLVEEEALRKVEEIKRVYSY